MKKLSILILSTIFALLSAGTHSKSKASLQDRDLDGVPDRYDRCPHTPFFALVNKKGCMVKRLDVSREKERRIRELLAHTR